MSKEVEKAKKYLRMMNNSIDSDMYANEPIETILKYIEELEEEIRIMSYI